MSGDPKATPPPVDPMAKAKERLDQLLKDRAIREEVRAAQRLERQIEREELAAKFEAEHGAEGAEFTIIDSGHLGDALVVVKRPESVQWTKYEQSKQLPSDRYDFVAPSIAHPDRDTFNALRNRRIGVEIQCSNAMAAMMGLVEAGERGK